MPDEQPEAEVKKPVRRKREAEICPQCWPDGWPAEDATSAVCDHGSYKR